MRWLSKDFCATLALAAALGVLCPLCPQANAQPPSDQRIHVSPAPGTNPQQPERKSTPGPANGQPTANLGPGQRIQFSPLSSPLAISNLTAAVENPGLNRLNPEPSGFKQVQEDLFRPLTDAMQPVDSMGGVMAVPLPAPEQSQQPVMDKHTRQLLEQRRNWAFTDLNDLYPEQNAEEMLGVKQYGDDGREKEAKSPIDNYYEKLGQKQADGSNAKYQWGNGTDANGIKIAVSTNGLNGIGQNYTGNDLFQKTIFAPGQEDNSGGVFAPVNSRSPGSIEEDRQARQAQQKHDNEFGRMLDPNYQPPKQVDSLSAIGLDRLLPSPPEKIQVSQAAPQPYRSSINPMLGVADPNDVFHSHVFDDPTARALGLPNPKPAAPPPAPPKTAQSMEDMLNPYAASVVKRKF